MLKQKLLTLFISIFLFMSILLSNLLYLTFNQNFYKGVFKKEKIYENFQSENQVNSAAYNLLSYFRGKNKLDFNFYSEQAELHLKDVKNLLEIARILNIIVSISLLAIVIYLLFKNRKEQIRRSLVFASILLTSLILLSFILSLLSFDWSFIYFHQLLFTNNLWLFPPQDNLIKLFPETFFVAFARQLLINILICIFLLLIAAYFLPKNDSKNP